VSEHTAALEAVAGIPDTARAQLAQYLDLVARWNGKVNLTAARTPAERVAQLVLPVIGAAPWVRGPRLLDVGSGNGSPGVPLSVLRPDVQVTLLEPRTRRWAFLREVVRELGLGARIDARRERHDAHVGGPVETVTARAVALSPEDLGPLLAPGGVVLRWRPDETPPPGWRAIGRWDRGLVLGRST
jgi:16S rRNA (guanine527-N7)-methyltransferase